MASVVTIDDLKELWSGAIIQINRGDEYAPITQEDLYAVANGLDVDDDGNPADNGQWEVLADQFNSVEPGETTSSAQDIALQEIAAARRRHETAKTELAATKDDLASARQYVGDTKTELDQAITSALAAGAPVASIAAEADLSVPRIYQIRDGRR